MYIQAFILITETFFDQSFFQVFSTLGIALACSSLEKKWDIRQTIGWILTSLPIFIISLYIIHKLIVEFSKKDNLQKSEVSGFFPKFLHCYY